MYHTRYDGDQNENNEQVVGKIKQERGHIVGDASLAIRVLAVVRARKWCARTD
eukprot:SAG31_NODE_36739_length_310_cov_1.947867_2_plen_52_part_01